MSLLGLRGHTYRTSIGLNNPVASPDEAPLEQKPQVSCDGPLDLSGTDVTQALQSEPFLLQ